MSMAQRPKLRVVASRYTKCGEGQDVFTNIGSREWAAPLPTAPVLRGATGGTKVDHTRGENSARRFIPFAPCFHSLCIVE